MRLARGALVLLLAIVTPAALVLVAPEARATSVGCLDKWLGEEVQFDVVQQDLGLEDAIVYGELNEARMHVDTTRPLTPLEKLRVRQTSRCPVTFRVVRHGHTELGNRAGRVFDLLAAADEPSLDCLSVGPLEEINGVEAGAVGGIPRGLQARARRLVAPTPVVFQTLTRADCQVPK